MTHKASHKEIHQLLPDYVLGLLSPGQAEVMAEHLADCADCREEVLVEREIGLLVRGTLAAATRPEPARLRSLMPAVPRQPNRGRNSINWTMRVAPALVVLAVILGSFLMRAPDGKRPMSLFIGATATATSTNTPTATIAQESSSTEIEIPAEPEVSSARLPESVLESPAPALAAPVPILSPTPAAAGSRSAAN